MEIAVLIVVYCMIEEVPKKFCCKCIAALYERQEEFKQLLLIFLKKIQKTCFFSLKVKKNRKKKSKKSKWILPKGYDEGMGAVVVLEKDGAKLKVMAT